MKIKCLITCLLSSLAFGTCHNLDTTSALQDVIGRWLSKGATLYEFNVLSKNWQKPGFLSTNPCITFEMKKDTELTAHFEPVEPTVEESLLVEAVEVDTRTERERMYPLMETVWINHTGKRYHLETCFWRGLVPIQTNVLEAMLAGKTACGHCNPFVEE